MASLDVRGAHLFFTDEGADEDPMVFVHGFTCDSHDWSWQLPHFAATHRVIALDLRGHGRSSAPDDGYDIPSLTADVAALIDHLGCGPLVAIGHSLGGAIVCSMAVERPDLVRAVVAVDAGHLLPDERAPGLAAALAAYEGDDPGALPVRAFDAGSHRALTSPAIATWHNRRAVGMPDHVLRNTMIGLIGGPTPFALVANSAPYLSRVDRAVLSIFVDPGRGEIADKVFTHPQSRSVLIEGAGHWVQQERPETMNAIVDDWLHELEPQT